MTFAILFACVAVAMVAALQVRSGAVVEMGGNPTPQIIAMLAVLPGKSGELWRWMTYALTHDWNGIWHLIGNMIFLLAFGRAVERRIGSLGFLALFLGAAVLSAVAEAILVPQIMLVGASGAICGVTGAFLALFPKARVRFLNLFILLGIFSLPAPIAVGIQVAFDLMGFLGSGEGNVAYAAHLAGYLAGFGTMVLLLATGMISRTEWDVVFAWKQRGRRNAMKRAVEDSKRHGPWAGAEAPSSSTRTRPIPAKPVSKGDALRLALARSDDAAAVTQWIALGPDREDVDISPHELVRIGNALAQRESWESAVEAWRIGLTQMGGGSSSDEVRVLAAAVAWKRLRNKAESLSLLDGLSDGSSIAIRSTAAQLRAEMECA